MRQAQWQLQTAKAQLSKLVEVALRGEPQRITRRGKDAVMVLSEKAYVAPKFSAKNDTRISLHIYSPCLVSALLGYPMPQKRTQSSSSAIFHCEFPA